MADISINFAGIKSPNPFWVASAPPSNTAYQCHRAFEAGWGGVVWKTIGDPILNVSSRYSSHTINGARMAGFNNIELKKADFMGLAQFHHSMFDDIKFPDGWIETISYHGENWKEGNGDTWTNQWTEWTATSKISNETHTNRSHFNYKWENGKIVEVNALFSDLWYDKEVKLFMEKQK